MTMIYVNSSFIEAVSYDGYTLTVPFHNGRTYDHPAVPERHYHGLLNATSPGWHFNAYLKGNYQP